MDISRYKEDLEVLRTSSVKHNRKLTDKLIEKMLADWEAGTVSEETVGYILFGLINEPHIQNHYRNPDHIAYVSSQLELPEAHRVDSTERLWKELKEEIANKK